MARASIHLINLDKKIYHEQTYLTCSHINVGCGEDLSVKELAEIIKNVVDFKGEIKFDSNKPDETLRKFLDSKKKNNTRFKHQVNLKDGLIKTYQDYLKN